MGGQEARLSASACELTRYITHVFLWMGSLYHPHPIRYITHAGNFRSQCQRGIQSVIHRRNARARFLTLKVFNVTTNKGLWITERSSKGHPCGVPPASPAPPPAQLALTGEEQKKPRLLNLIATGGLSGSVRQAGPTWPQAAPLRAPRPGQIGLRPQAGRRLSRVSVETALIAPSKIKLKKKSAGQRAEWERQCR